MVHMMPPYKSQLFQEPTTVDVLVFGQGAATLSGARYLYLKLDMSRGTNDQSVPAQMWSARRAGRRVGMPINADTPNHDGIHE